MVSSHLLLITPRLICFVCHSRTMYAYTTDSFFPLLVTQGFGEIVGILYIIVGAQRRGVFVCTNSTQSPLPFGVWLPVRFTLLGLWGVFGQTRSELGTSLGYIGCASSISMVSSPLATLKHVVSIKLSASFPINKCTMIFVSSALWTGAGIVDSDYFVAAINLVGVLLSCSQIIIYFMYRPGKYEIAEQLEGGKLSTLSPRGDTCNKVFVESPAYYKTMPSPLVSEKV
ncbi:Bidirectional sugar transporter SWEET3b [Phytophthora citrophthora]|uniref:Sugar transporter SWEET1 n=1 Tax=Phytophthora citrophthora TaxID=4793 RepID=A0AAD9G862_9STRA|nr:Bidirectional sugar transporter SWEET3b [Phytophthora citrophthora]